MSNPVLAVSFVVVVVIIAFVVVVIVVYVIAVIAIRFVVAVFSFVVVVITVVSFLFWLVRRSHTGTSTYRNISGRVVKCSGFPKIKF